ncbi:MAG TPA: GtrA family protein [Solirubrobacteraceae bacterium]|nr:GtrA family protein [Solirubrobacteraceae bacterium]
MSERETLRPAAGAPALAHRLRAPDPGVLRQGLRFVLAGGTVTLLYPTITTVLANVAGVPFQAALAIGFCAGVAVHFTLQRLFVWRRREKFALPLHHQVGRYLAVAAAQYGVTAASTSLLPPALGVSTESVYLVTVTVLICTNFMVFRHVVFHAQPGLPERRPPVREREPRALPGRGRAGGALRRGVRGRLRTPAVIDAAIAMLAILLIASPLLLTRNGFAPDFTNDIWLSDYQRHVIAAHLHPTLFLQLEQGVFDPLFAFYGGTLFALTGALGAVFGSTILAFEVMTLAAIAAAYGGLFWLARQLGVRGVMAHAPAIVFVTSAYYITDLYGRGAWAEFMAISALPLVIAASLSLVRGRRRAGPAVCLVAASVVLSGSHNITLLWSSVLAVLALALYWLLSGRSRELPWRRMAGAAGLIALGVGLNGWFLLPDLRYAHDTLISGQIIPWSATGEFNSAGVIFDPLRTVPSNSETPALYVQIPMLALAWGLLAAPLAWRYRSLRAGIATALIALAGLLVLIMSSGVYSRLPNLLQEIQFAYRLQTYVTLACAGLVLLGTLALTRRAQSARATRTRADRGLEIGLGLAIAFGVALSAWQLWVPNTHINLYYRSYADRAEALAGPPTVLPASWNARNNYGDSSLPILTPAGSIAFNPTTVSDDRLAGSGRLPASEAFATNIVGGPYLVHVGGGVRVVGRTAEGYLVLQRKTNGSRPVPIELSAQLSAPVVLGRITTAVSAALLLALAILAAVRWRRGSASDPPLERL